MVLSVLPFRVLRREPRSAKARAPKRKADRPHWKWPRLKNIRTVARQLGPSKWRVPERSPDSRISRSNILLADRAPGDSEGPPEGFSGAEYVFRFQLFEFLRGDSQFGENLGGLLALQRRDRRKLGNGATEMCAGPHLA